MLPLIEGYADLAEVRLHFVEAGEGPLVILLHGFPDFWYGWRHQISALAIAGYRVVAPDMRGYNLSGKPRVIDAYGINHLTDDVAQLISHLGAEQAAVVGHDWGAGVAWATAMRHPECVERLGILNVPHPARFMQGLKTWRQMLKSWYMLFFQLPGIPEAAIRAGNFASLRTLLKTDPVRPGAFTSEDVERYVEAASQPGALTGAINYYRAAMRGRGSIETIFRRIEQPVLVIWGERDRYLGRELAEPDPEWVPNCRVVRLPDASHWVQADEPERVNQLLIEFLGAPTSQM